MKKEKNGTLIKYISITILAFLNACSISFILDIISPKGGYFGTDIYGWNPACIAFFFLDCFALNRFLRKELLQHKIRIIFSSILGILVSSLSVMGMMMYHEPYSIFDNLLFFFECFLSALGISLLTIPCVNELFGFFDNVTSRNQEPFIPKNTFLTNKPWLYFALMWTITFISFVPLFLYWWPGNFICDANFQVINYMDYLSIGYITTHHPLLHTLLLGGAYNYGFQIGNVNQGLMYFTLFQMAILSASAAFFMTYLYNKKINRKLRVIAYLSFVLNPVNAYFAISTIKGVLSAAFLLISLTFLLFLLDSKNKSTKIINAIGFIFFCIMSCFFRNNMYYAVIIAGLIIILLQKGFKKKLLFLALILSILLGFKLSNHILVKQLNATESDTQRESMSVPLMCLARTATHGRSKISDIEYNEICSYIPESALDEYSIFIADSIKNNASEELLKTNKINFIKLFIKLGLKCPGEYIETIIGLTTGYWYAFDYPYFLTGSTKLFSLYISPDYPSIENKNFLPIGSKIFDYMYGENERRLRIPLLGYLWKGTLYVWGYLFAISYLIYKRNRKGLTVLLIPAMYMLSCFLGPVSFLRYIYINIALLPLLIYVLSTGERE